MKMAIVYRQSRSVAARLAEREDRDKWEQTAAKDPFSSDTLARFHATYETTCEHVEVEHRNKGERHSKCSQCGNSALVRWRMKAYDPVESIQ